MPKYRSIPVAQENDPAWWNFAQEASTLADLESQHTYDSISHITRASWHASRANDTVRVVAGTDGTGTISVVSYVEIPGISVPVHLHLVPLKKARKKKIAKSSKKKLK